MDYRASLGKFIFHMIEHAVVPVRNYRTSRLLVCDYNSDSDSNCDSSIGRLIKNNLTVFAVKRTQIVNFVQRKRFLKAKLEECPFKAVFIVLF